MSERCVIIVAGGKGLRMGPAETVYPDGRQAGFDAHAGGVSSLGSEGPAGIGFA